MSSLFVKWGKRKSETHMLADEELDKDDWERRVRKQREEAKARGQVVPYNPQWREPSREATKRRSELEAGNSTTLMGTTFYPDERR